MAEFFRSLRVGQSETECLESNTPVTFVFRLFTGVICLDILKDQWAAAMTLRIVLLSLQALLSAAEPDDPQVSRFPQQRNNIVLDLRILRCPEIGSKRQSRVIGFDSDPDIPFCD